MSLLGKTYDLDTTGDLPSLSVKLFHKGAFSISDVPLGEVTIPLLMVNGDSVAAYDRWFKLEKTGRMKDVSGQVHLSMRFSRPATKRDQYDHDDDDDDDGDGAVMTIDPEQLQHDDDIEYRPNELSVIVSLL